MVDVMRRDFQHDREAIRPRSVALRSAHDCDRGQDLLGTATAAASAPLVVGEPVGTTLRRYRLERELGAGTMGVVHAAFDLDLEDRKSTRLNSSHVASSYAVFCLKKKKSAA